MACAQQDHEFRYGTASNRHQPGASDSDPGKAGQIVNITDTAPVITADEPDRIQYMHFKLIPYNARSLDDFKHVSTFNATAERLMESKIYGPLFRNHKVCLILTDGFRENKKQAPGIGPYLFTLKDREIFAFAGLWSRWIDPQTKQPYDSFAIITTEANSIVGEIHDRPRMPVILHKEDEDKWLDKSTPIEELLALCVPYPSELMNVRPVEKAPTKPRHKGNWQIGLDL